MSYFGSGDLRTIETLMQNASSSGITEATVQLSAGKVISLKLGVERPVQAPLTVTAVVAPVPALRPVTTAVARQPFHRPVRVLADYAARPAAPTKAANPIPPAPLLSRFPGLATIKTLITHLKPKAAAPRATHGSTRGAP